MRTDKGSRTNNGSAWIEFELETAAKVSSSARQLHTSYRDAQAHAKSDCVKGMSASETSHALIPFTESDCCLHAGDRAVSLLQLGTVHGVREWCSCRSVIIRGKGTGLSPSLSTLSQPSCL